MDKMRKNPMFQNCEPKDVFLINAPLYLAKHVHFRQEIMGPSLGIMYIASFLRKHGINAGLIDLCVENIDLEQLLEFIEISQVKVVGISCITYSMKAGVVIAREIKRRFADKVHVCLGGAHVSVDSGIINRYPFFDTAVTGEGELIFKEIVEKVFRGQKPKGIFAGKMCENLDELPFPAWDLIRKSAYGDELYHILTSRGCPFECNFCSNVVFNKQIRFRSARDVTDEISVCFDRNKQIYFCDDTFTYNRQHVTTLCRRLIDKKTGIRWKANTRVEFLDDELLRLMAEAGCEEITFGIESGSEHIRKNVVGKNISDVQIGEAVRACKRYKIQVTFFLMLGFPTETKADVRTTAYCGIKFKPDKIVLRLTKPIHGSRLFEQAVVEKAVNADIIDRYISDEVFVDVRKVWPSYVPEGLSLGYLRMMYLLGNLFFYLCSPFIWRRLLKDLFDWRQLKKDVCSFIGTLASPMS